jgi:SAM-dependent methyltransferase
MLGNKDPSNINWLDVGSCDSVVPLYVASLGINAYVNDFPEYEDYYAHNRFGLPINFVPILNSDRSTGAPRSLDYKINTNATFDVVTCISMIEHIPAYEERFLIEEMARLTKPGGLLYITTDVNTVANYDPTLRIGKQSLLWHIFDKKALQENIIDPCARCGFDLIGDLDFQPGKPENRLRHLISCNLCNILALFFRKRG